MPTLNPRIDPEPVSTDYYMPNVPNIKELVYGMTYVIRVGERTRRAVVDIFIPSILSTPKQVFDNFDATGIIRHTKIKLVWKEPNGSWRQILAVRDVTREEFLEWRKKFVNGRPPLPMPV